MDKGFAELWRDAQRQRGEYLGTICSGMFVWLRSRHQEAEPIATDTYAPEHHELPKAA